MVAHMTVAVLMIQAVVSGLLNATHFFVPLMQQSLDHHSTSSQYQTGELKLASFPELYTFNPNYNKQPVLLLCTHTSLIPMYIDVHLSQHLFNAPQWVSKFDCPPFLVPAVPMPHCHVFFTPAVQANGNLVEVGSVYLVNDVSKL